MKKIKFLILTIFLMVTLVGCKKSSTSSKISNKDEIYQELLFTRTDFKPTLIEGTYESDFINLKTEKNNQTFLKYQFVFRGNSVRLRFLTFDSNKPNAKPYLETYQNGNFTITSNRELNKSNDINFIYKGLYMVPLTEDIANIFNYSNHENFRNWQKDKPFKNQNFSPIVSYNIFRIKDDKLYLGTEINDYSKRPNKIDETLVYKKIK